MDFDDLMNMAMKRSWTAYRRFIDLSEVHLV